jgi:Ca-activated chloride channel family protein
MRCGSRSTVGYKRVDMAVAQGLVKTLTLVVLLGSYAGSQVAPAANRQDTEAYRLSVDVNLVVLHATVRDRQGRFAADLRQQDFEVYENGIRQVVRLFQHEDVAVTVGLVVDHSISMHPKLAEVTTAAKSFVKYSNPEDEMFVVNFNEGVSMGLPGAIRFSNDSTELGGAIWKFPANGETALYDAIATALERLQEGHNDKKVLLVISDGGDNASTHKLAQVIDLAGRSTAAIYTIGLFGTDDPDRNPGVLHRLAQATGGEAFFPSQLDEVVGICERIAREIRNQYTIGYVPTGTARSGAYRTIRVVARATGRGKLFVRARTGYITAGESGTAGKGAAK